MCAGRRDPCACQETSGLLDGDGPVCPQSPLAGRSGLGASRQIPGAKDRPESTRLFAGGSPSGSHRWLARLQRGLRALFSQPGLHGQAGTSASITLAGFCFGADSQMAGGRSCNRYPGLSPLRECGADCAFATQPASSEHGLHRAFERHVSSASLWFVSSHPLSCGLGGEPDALDVSGGNDL